MTHHSSNSLVFALDIGTRSVVGLLGAYEDHQFRVYHSAMALHQSRAMFDGQIHDIEQVAAIARQVKEELEEKSGMQLKEVAIAAAGRALRTQRLEIEKEIDENKPIDKLLINSLEIEGLQRAHIALEEQFGEHQNYFSVGHTVVNSYVNQVMITNPIGHKGKFLKLDLLVTFLPYAVVDSLNTVMNKIGLEVTYLTLEPIAAISVAVPQNVRLLNVALVDIGAGTSDIAITKDGSIVAYAMTSTAGDEVTEAIARHYLLDFDTAEKMKCQLNRQELHRVTDIIGLSHELTTEEIVEKAADTIQVIAKDIADHILAQNGKAPSAIFLIGGGSQIPGLSLRLATLLDMPKERVVVRGTEIIQNLKQENLQAYGPEGITPIGILAKAIENKETDFIDLFVNGKEIRLFRSKSLKVSDALVLAGFNPRDLIPKRGKVLNLKVNGELKSFYGDYGQPAEIYLNQVAASLDSAIQHGDVVAVKPAKMGKDAALALNQLVTSPGTLTVNGKRIQLIYDVTVNGQSAPGNPILKEGDEVNYQVIRTLQQLADHLSLALKGIKIMVNGHRADAFTSLSANDVILYEQEEEILEQPSALQPPPAPVLRLKYNGADLEIPKGAGQPIFVDIFNYVDFDRQQVKGKLILLHNGQPANYVAPLCDGDEIQVGWKT